MSLPITALILTYNEEKHIARCLQRLHSVVERVCIVDSFSTDKTLAIASENGAEIIQNSWKNYADQYQFGLDNFNIESDWTLRIDADEYLDEALQASLKLWFHNNFNNEDVNAVFFKRKVVFLGRPIKHGFFYPAYMLRLWKTGEGRIEQRWMDEHVTVESARSKIMQGDLIDENLNDLTWWINKHNGYATREAYDLVRVNQNIPSASKDLQGMGKQASTKRFLKEKIYSKMPSGIRVGLYFIYRYLIGMGFLDGKEGFYFHFMQAFWYRMLVDAKLFELDKRARELGLTPYELLQSEGVFLPFKNEFE